MSAERLRQAAEEIRAKAEAVRQVRRETPGELHGGQGANYGAVFIENAFAEHAPGDADDPDLRRIWRADSEHLAAWQDVDVALAVADWLDLSASDVWAWGPMCECGTGCDACDDSEWETHARHALAVADAILGGAS